MADTPTPTSAATTEVDDATLARVLRCDPMTIRRYYRLAIIQRSSNRPAKYPLFQSIGNVVEYLRNMAGRQNDGENLRAGAALKQAQRRLTEIKLAKLDGSVLSMAEVEALWGDLAAAAKWLFLSLPTRLRQDLALSEEAEAQVKARCVEMLEQVAFYHSVQLPTAGSAETGDSDDDDDDAHDPPAIPPPDDD